ncbi:hypothetical protein ACFQ7G_08685 [Streptomyces massasporeus]
MPGRPLSPAHQAAAAPTSVVTVAANVVATSHRSASTLGRKPKGAARAAHRQTTNEAAPANTVTAQRLARCMRPPCLDA